MDAINPSPKSKNLIPTAAQLFERLPRTLRRHRLMKAWMTLTREDPRQLVRIRDQSFGYADMSDGFLRLIVIEGDFEREFFAIADECLGNGGVFLDVGANFGLLSCGLAGRQGSKVQFHLFEPNRTLVEWIKRSMARYPAVDFKINCTAVSDRLGVISFMINKDQTGASHITPEGGEQIRSVTIDEYLDRENIATVNLMKLDIEGAELLALRGAQELLLGPSAPVIVLEVNPRTLALSGTSADEVLGLLSDCGYSCRPIATYGSHTPDPWTNMLAAKPGHRERFPTLNEPQ